MQRRIFLFGLVPLVASACADSFDCGSAPENSEDRRRQMLECQSPTEPTPVPAPTPNTIEFRVLGDIVLDPGTNGVEIQFGSTEEGTSRVLSTLPWFSSTRTFRDTLFLALNAQASGFGVLQVQIIINGQLFREASASGFNPRVAVSGQFVK